MALVEQTNTKNSVEIKCRNGRCKHVNRYDGGGSPIRSIRRTGTSPVRNNPEPRESHDDQEGQTT